MSIDLEIVTEVGLVLVQHKFSAVLAAGVVDQRVVVAAGKAHMQVCLAQGAFFIA